MKTNLSCYKKFPFGLAKAILLPFMFLVMFLSSFKASMSATNKVTGDFASCNLQNNVVTSISPK
ncbi:MAG: hypothetical protein ACOYN4_19985, partial [Bacteroidales bacterium]